MNDTPKALALATTLATIATASATFDAYATSSEPPSEPAVNNIYCAPALVVVCKRGGNDLSCQEFGSKDEALDYWIRTNQPSARAN